MLIRVTTFHFFFFFFYYTSFILFFPTVATLSDFGDQSCKAEAEKELCSLTISHFTDIHLSLCKSDTSPSQLLKPFLCSSAFAHSIDTITTIMTSHEHSRLALEVLHYIFPLIVLGYFLVATSISICTLQSLKSQPRKIPRKPWLILQGFIFGLYLAEGLMLLSNTIFQDASSSSKDANVGLGLNYKLGVRTSQCCTTI